MQQFYSNMCISRAVFWIIQEGSTSTATAHTYWGCLGVLLEHFWNCVWCHRWKSYLARSNHLWHHKTSILFIFAIFLSLHTVLLCPPLYYGIFYFKKYFKHMQKIEQHSEFSFTHHPAQQSSVYDIKLHMCVFPFHPLSGL